MAALKARQEGTKYSPEFQALKGRYKPTVTLVWTHVCIRLFFRPYRAFILLAIYSQGVALGYIIVALSGRHDRRANGL